MSIVPFLKVTEKKVKKTKARENIIPTGYIG